MGAVCGHEEGNARRGGNSADGMERNALAGINAFAAGDPTSSSNPDPPADGRLPTRTAGRMSSSCGRFRRSVHSGLRVRSGAGASRPGIDVAGNTAADVELVVSHLEQFAYHWLNILVNANGNFDSWWHYYQPG